jgi:hypothetical protein
MATIPQIAMGFRQPEIASPLNMMAQVSQIQAAQDANALRQFQMQQALRQQEQENALVALPYGTLAATPQEALRYGAPGRQLYESLLKGSKEKRETELAEARIAGENIKTAKASLGGVSDQSTFDAWRENTVRLLPGLAGALPTTYSPEAVRKLALDADKLYENVTSTMNLGRIQTVVQTPKYGGGLARPVGSFAEMPTELDVARTEQAQASAGASRAQARLEEERVEIARRAESTAQRRLDAEERRLASTEKRLTNEERRLALAEENARLAQDPEHQRAMAAARAAGQAVARSEQAAIDVLPKVIDTAAAALANIDAMIGSPERKDPVTGKVIPATKPHPGFTTVVGATMLPGARFVPGTAAADFQARFDQIKGSAFLQAYETLKGGGQITNIEGEKGTAALNRMSIAQSEREFIQAAREFQEVVQKGLERAQRRAQELQSPSQRSGAPRGAAPSGAGQEVNFGDLK